MDRWTEAAVHPSAKVSSHLKQKCRRGIKRTSAGIKQPKTASEQDAALTLLSGSVCSQRGEKTPLKIIPCSFLRWQASILQQSHRRACLPLKGLAKQIVSLANDPFPTAALLSFSLHVVVRREHFGTLIKNSNSCNRRRKGQGGGRGGKLKGEVYCSTN